MRRIGALLFPYFHAFLVRAAQPALHARPVAACRAGRVIGVSPELTAYDLIGMTVARARGRCPDAVFTEPEPERCAAAGGELLELAASVSPMVEIAGENACFFDFGARVMPGDLERLKEGAGKIPCGPAVLGIGRNRLLAGLAARLRVRSPLGPGVVRCEVAEGREEAFLNGLSLALDPSLTADGLKTLARMGIETFGDARGVAEAELIRLIGREGRILFRHCRGRDPEPLLAQYPPDRLGWRAELEGGAAVPLSRLEDLCAAAAAALAKALAEKRSVSRTVTLFLTAGALTFQAERIVVWGMRDEWQLRETLRQLLAGLVEEMSPSGVPPDGLAVALTGLGDWNLCEQDLFSADRRSDRPKTDMVAVARALSEKMPGKIGLGMTAERREQVFAFWDPWRF